MNAPLPHRLHPAPRLLLPMRLGVSSVAKITLSNGDELLCPTETLSRKELVINCTQEMLTQILPRGCTEPDKMMHVQATFSLPDGVSENSKSRQTVQGEAVVFAARRVARNRFLLQLRFTRLSLPQASVIEQFIEHHKATA